MALCGKFPYLSLYWLSLNLRLCALERESPARRIHVRDKNYHDLMYRNKQHVLLIRILTGFKLSTN